MEICRQVDFDISKRRMRRSPGINNIYIFNTIFVSSHMYPENPEGTQAIVGSINMGYYCSSLLLEENKNDLILI